MAEAHIQRAPLVLVEILLECTQHVSHMERRGAEVQDCNTPLYFSRASSWHAQFMKLHVRLNQNNW